MSEITPQVGAFFYNRKAILVIELKRTNNFEGTMTYHMSNFNKEVRYVIIIVLFFTVTQSATFGQISGLHKGDRVRVSINSNSQQFIGRFTKISGSNIQISAKSSGWSIPVSTINSLEKSQGKKRRWKLGYCIGAVAGAVVSGLLFTEKPKCDNCLDFTELNNFANVMYGAGIGAATGALVGLAFKADKWRRVPVDFSLGVSSSPKTHTRLKPSILLKLSIKSKK